MKKLTSVFLLLLLTSLIIFSPFYASAVMVNNQKTVAFMPMNENDLSETDRIYELGDVNKDNNVNTLDALCILKYKVGTMTLPADALLLADVDRSGSVMVVDAVYILQYSVKLITDFFQPEK